MLDDYFEGLGTRFSADGGVLGQFQGDALIATSSVHVSNENYVSAALRAGLSIEEIMDRETSRDKKLRTWIGLKTGPVVSEGVSIQGRRSYMVSGISKRGGTD